MKRLFTLMFCVLSSVAMYAQVYTYYTADKNCRLIYDSQQQRVKLHCDGDFYYTLISTNADKSTTTVSFAPASWGSQLMPGQEIVVICIWNDGREDIDIMFYPRTYRDLFADKPLIFGGKFFRHMQSVPSQVTLSIPFEEELADVTFYRE